MEPEIRVDRGDYTYMPFKTPISLIIAGSSFSGKTFFIANLLKHKNEMFQPEFKEIIFVYSSWQPIYDELENALENIKFITRIPSKSEIENITSDLQPRLIIFDDQMTHLAECPDITEYFTVFTHHKNLSCILVLQNLFYQAQCVRDISYNVQGLILFRNLRSPHQVGVLASQMFPGKKRKYFLSAYEDACVNTPFGYLFCDINPKHDTKFQLRTNILPGSNVKIYMPKYPDEKYR